MRNILYITLIILLITDCKPDNNINLNVSICDTTIEYNSEYFSRNKLIINFIHKGFCIDEIETVMGSYYKQKSFQNNNDTLFFEKQSKQLMFLNKKENNSEIEFALDCECEEYEFIELNFEVKYKNQITSNIIQRLIKVPCPKVISQLTYQTIPAESCTTTAGQGDRYMIEFQHKGFCSNEIDSLHIKGIFMDNDGYEWSTSEFSKPATGLIIATPDSFLTNINSKLCVTWAYSDFVKTTIYLVYKDKTRSNLQTINIDNPYYDKRSRKKAQKLE